MSTKESESPDAVGILIGQFTPDPKSPLDASIQKALLLAKELQKRAQVLQTPSERKQQMELDRMIQNPKDKVTLTKLTDQAFRSGAAKRAANQLIHVLDVQGIPRFFSPLERTLLRGFQTFGSYLPGVAIPLVKEQMRKETANVILPAEREVLEKHLNQRRSEGVRMNVNFLGEAILGEKEAAKRYDQYHDALGDPGIEVVSVKVSTIYSQIHPVGREKSIQAMCDRLAMLYRRATEYSFKRADGKSVPKFVYLDMEEYRDMTLTAEVFMRTLDLPEMLNLPAGIVLQAYIPDSFLVQQQITQWARKRVENGGAPVTMRIVKGANMEMERVEASAHGWPQAPFKTKVETDANYKQMVQFAMKEENRRAVKPGIASHNLFDISYALVLAFELNALGDIQFEMLEGMANHQRRALHEFTRNMLLYAPACDKENFIHAIGYLIRRLDENTGDENFLRHAFNITVDSPAWTKLEKGFLDAFRKIESLDNSPRRTQNRSTETIVQEDSPQSYDGFQNEPDTDFSLPQNAKWGEEVIAKWEPLHSANATKIPLFVAGKEIDHSQRQTRQCLDPSRPGIVVGNYAMANEEDANSAIECAKSDPDQWRNMAPRDRQKVLQKVATEIRKSRGDLMGAAIADGGKTLMESDPEVSEAIDFCEFYAATAVMFSELDGVQATGQGVVVVVSPWNFPIAIPCGGIAAALAAGNTVILKPASNTVLVAHFLCECFYRAGVPRTALQWLPCSGGTVGQQLVAHQDVDTVILTGGTDTAIRMLEHKPTMNLLAETGGKNATIVTSISDRDQAIKHICHSAFGHGGQKCSATSLLLLENEVFEDKKFRSALIDAVESIHVGSAWEADTKMAPLIAPPEGDLENGLTRLEEGESWALKPQNNIDNNPCLHSPGIKWNVARGSYTHCTEFFGPILGVMRFSDIEEAIDIVNDTGYGLTSGLESLDEREQKIWKESISAGNLYINRPTTGAIVLRQPFGGRGKSAFGPGIKAGGPNYVAQLMKFEMTGNPTRDGKINNENRAKLAKDLARYPQKPTLDDGPTQEEIDKIFTAIDSYDFAAMQEFNRRHDHFRLIGQDNVRKYTPVEVVCIRLHEADSWFEIFGRIVAAQAVGSRILVSVPSSGFEDKMEFLHLLTENWAGDIEFANQSDEELAVLIQAQEIGRIRYARPERVPISIRNAVIGQYIFIADAPVLDEGRIELMWYIQEQSISVDYHRYGNLGSRSEEERSKTL